MSTTYENAENIPMSKTSDTVELKQTVNSDCLSDDKNLGRVVSDVYPSIHVARPLSPTLAKALEEYEGDLLVSGKVSYVRTFVGHYIRSLISTYFMQQRS